MTVMGCLYRQVPAQTIELLVMRNRMRGICNPEPLGFSVRESRSTRRPSAGRRSLKNALGTTRSLIDRRATQYQDAKSA
jgi:hypothetical protein